MKTLFIIGNGFDIAHGLDTSYWNFREYLDDSYPEFLQEFEWMYNIGRIDFSDPRVPAGTRERWEESVNHELWSEFEEKMGQPNISEMMDASTSCRSAKQLRIKSTSKYKSVAPAIVTTMTARI